MRKFMVFSLASIGALTLLAGTAAAGAAGLFFYSAERSCSMSSDMPVPRQVEWTEPTEVSPPQPEGAMHAVEVPAALDRDEELVTLKAQLAAALQRIAELEAEEADKAPAEESDSDF